MKSPTLALLFAATIASAGCRTVTVEPEIDAPVIAAPRHLDFHLRWSYDSSLVDPSLDPYTIERDGELRAEKTQWMMSELLDDDAFTSVRRAKPGQGLHCELHMKVGSHMGTQGMIVFMTGGIAPDYFEHVALLEARVTAPGREPRDYAIRAKGETWVWVPLLPIGLVQMMFQRDPEQVVVDTLIAQMAADGWFETN